MEFSYWNSNGKYQHLAGELHKLVPAAGQVRNPEQNPVRNPEQNPALERFRLYANAYYDIFINGGWNYPKVNHFLTDPKDIYRWFPGAMSRAKKGRWDAVCIVTESRMDKVILAAAREQGLINNVEAA